MVIKDDDLASWSPTLVDDTQRLGTMKEPSSHLLDSNGFVNNGSKSMAQAMSSNM
eukprot:CAMPEP_0170506326 /NCGR_PEP_ID=MMETSP0208-20121228/54508_1 /TAXON_ID=197538 /ORGANISM="Strombidium inclinatum, Strain S3" /LENGTH=54 /DNA_ID=CAMNT_0010787783 /DNA_START=94 /DNA_END=258 /DNA_ORIENTATION=-